MMESIVLLTDIQASRLTEKIAEDADVSFEVESSLSEVLRSSDKMVIQFKIDLEPRPQLAKISLTGLATVQGEEEEIEKLILTQEGNPPRIFMNIYQRIYPILYLLCCSLKIPCPGPKLLVNAHIEETQAVRQYVKP